MQHKQMILHIIELVVGVLQMPFARRFEGLSLIQYTVTRSMHHQWAYRSMVSEFGQRSAI